MTNAEIETANAALREDSREKSDVMRAMAELRAENEALERSLVMGGKAWRKDVEIYREQIAAARARIARLEAAANALLAHWDGHGGPEQRKKLGIADHEFWSPSASMVDTQFIADLRAALSEGEGHE